MALEIKQFNTKWQVFTHELWEFPNREEMIECIKELTRLKEKYGQISHKAAPHNY